MASLAGPMAKQSKGVHEAMPNIHKWTGRKKQAYPLNDEFLDVYGIVFSVELMSEVSLFDSCLPP